MNTSSTARSFTSRSRDAMVFTCHQFGATGALKSRGARGGLRSSSFSAARGARARLRCSTPTKPSSCRPKRPARPAIWCTSDSLSGRSSWPSNLVMVLNSTRRIGRFSPMPMASVATRMCDAPLREALGLAAAHLGRQARRRSRDTGWPSAAIWSRSISTSRRLNATTASPMLQRGERHRRAAAAARAACARSAARVQLSPHSLEQVLDGRHGIGRADDDHLVGRHADDGLRPGPAAVGVEDHLRLVDHRHVDGPARCSPSRSCWRPRARRAPARSPRR